MKKKNYKQKKRFGDSSGCVVVCIAKRLVHNLLRREIGFCFSFVFSAHFSLRRPLTGNRCAVWPEALPGARARGARFSLPRERRRRRWQCPRRCCRLRRLRRRRLRRSRPRHRRRSRRSQCCRPRTRTRLRWSRTRARPFPTCCAGWTWWASDCAQSTVSSLCTPTRSGPRRPSTGRARRSRPTTSLSTDWTTR